MVLLALNGNSEVPYPICKQELTYESDTSSNNLLVVIFYFLLVLGETTVIQRLHCSLTISDALIIQNVTLVPLQMLFSENKHL